MANSLRAKISKLRHDGNISEAEYQELIKKLDGHDKRIRAEVIDEIDRFMKNFPSLLCHLTVMEEWEKFKEQLKEQK